MKYFFFLLIIGLSSPLVKGQIFIQNTLHPFTRFVYNPAAAGVTEEANAAIMGRLQWLGIDGSPRTIAAFIETPLPSFDSGVGVHIIADQLGPLATTGIQLSYAYHLLVKGNAKLSIGASAGILQKSLNGNFIYNTDNGEDPLVPVGNYNSSLIVPGLNAGIYFSGPKDKYYIGISGQDLLEPSIEDLTLATGVGPDSRVARSFYLLGGYRFNVADNISLLANAAGRTDGVSYQLDAGAQATVNNKFIFGTSYRFIDNESVSGMVGIQITDKLMAAYAYDFVLSGLNSARDLSSHEIVLSYRMKVNRNKTGLDDTIKKRR